LIEKEKKKKKKKLKEIENRRGKLENIKWI